MRNDLRSEEERICKVCKKPFFPFKSNLRVGMGIYCSRSCKNIARALEKDYSYLDKVTQTELAYIAGLIDGEGCICFRKDSDALVLHITNTNTEVLEWVQIRLGGKIFKRKNDIPNRKDVHYWHVSTYHAYEIIKRLDKYLLIKKLQAQILKDFVERRFNLSGQQKMGIRSELKILNFRGKDL